MPTRAPVIGGASGSRQRSIGPARAVRTTDKQSVDAYFGASAGLLDAVDDGGVYTGGS